MATEVSADSYTGSEAAVDYAPTPTVDDTVVFEVRPPNIPARAVPIYDQDLGAVIGYREPGSVTKTYDLDGNLVAIEEPGLESPLIDPIDLIFFAGGILRMLGAGTVKAATSTGLRATALGAARLTAGALTRVVVGAMRTAFKGLSARALKFTAVTAARMATPSRFVPIHILHLALKYGKRAADPKGVKGAFLYTIKMLRNGTEYTLEVVVRESDWTVLHFLYK
jgi:hypothetical protein